MLTRLTVRLLSRLSVRLLRARAERLSGRLLTRRRLPELVGPLLRLRGLALLREPARLAEPTRGRTEARLAGALLLRLAV